MIRVVWQCVLAFIVFGLVCNFLFLADEYNLSFGAKDLRSLIAVALYALGIILLLVFGLKAILGGKRPK
jgi:hypothetical protein